MRTEGYTPPQKSEKRQDPELTSRENRVSVFAFVRVNLNSLDRQVNIITAACGTLARFRENPHRFLCLHVGLGIAGVSHIPLLWETRQQYHPLVS